MENALVCNFLLMYITMIQLENTSLYLCFSATVLHSVSQVSLVGMEWVTRVQKLLLVLLVAAQVDFVVGSFMTPTDGKSLLSRI